MGMPRPSLPNAEPTNMERMAKPVSPFLKAMQYYRKHRPYSSAPLGCFDDKLWTECCAMVKR